MRKTPFGQCTYSFFDDQFCRQFGIGRDMDWTEEYRDPHSKDEEWYGGGNSMP